VVRLFFVAENTIKGSIYLGMFKLAALPQTEDSESKRDTAVVFKQDMAQPHCSCKV
jgi:hypothetical protein